MGHNSEIQTNLQASIDQLSNNFIAINTACNTFKDLFFQLQNADKNKFEELLLQELISNCKDYWTSTERGVDLTEELLAILFEYDYYIFKINNEASAYGICDWQDFEIQTEDFSMGFNYDFAKKFEYCPGVTLQLFDALEILSGENLPDDLKNVDMSAVPGYFELIAVFKYITYGCLQNALNMFSKTKEFEKLNINKNFMFLIGEHDFGEVTPLWIAE